MGSSLACNPSLQALQQELCLPGKLLVFIDDSGTTGQPLGNVLVRDYVIHAATVVRSDDYPSFLNEHQALLSRHPGIDEFHTVELVNGRGQWEGRNIAERLEAFNSFDSLLRRLGQLVLHVGIGVEQYSELMSQVQKSILAPGNWKWKSHSEGARAVLLKSIVPQVRATFGELPLVLVEDADNERNDCCEQMFAPDVNVFADGVFRVDSRIVPGIQLADFAAYPLNRIYHIKSRLNQSRDPGPFDDLILDRYLANREKYRSVLAE